MMKIVTLIARPSARTGWSIAIPFEDMWGKGSMETYQTINAWAHTKPYPTSPELRARIRRVGWRVVIRRESEEEFEARGREWNNQRRKGR